MFGITPIILYKLVTSLNACLPGSLQVSKHRDSSFGECLLIFSWLYVFISSISPITSHMNS